MALCILTCRITNYKRRDSLESSTTLYHYQTKTSEVFTYKKPALHILRKRR